MRRSNGQGMVEYGLIIGLICVVTIAVLVSFSGNYGRVSRESEAVTQLTRIAVAQESQAKHLESIARWVWEPDPENRKVKHECRNVYSIFGGVALRAAEDRREAGEGSGSTESAGPEPELPTLGQGELGQTSSGGCFLGGAQHRRLVVH